MGCYLVFKLEIWPSLTMRPLIVDCLPPETQLNEPLCSLRSRLAELLGPPSGVGTHDSPYSNHHLNNLAAIPSDEPHSLSAASKISLDKELLRESSPLDNQNDAQSTPSKINGEQSSELSWLVG
ncbi:hypothetical protein P879_09793 [Paragonimus westermani]|uniref:Uncharacterized protein n=1 Tax=Paragonimus westermani TaxID=34504 RepID=A0A8T0DNJ9_9TREM|nr:hypothetical protein P879_09793 [Paragonimus westermani]